MVVIDGEFLPKRPIEMLRELKSEINVMVGNVEDEGSYMFSILSQFPKNIIQKPLKTCHSIEAFNELKRISSELPSNTALMAKKWRNCISWVSRNNNDFDLLRRTIGIAVGDYYLTCLQLNLQNKCSNKANKMCFNTIITQS